MMTLIMVGKLCLLTFLHFMNQNQLYIILKVQAQNLIRIKYSSWNVIDGSVLMSYYSTKTLVKIFPSFLLLEFSLFLFLIIKGMGLAKIKAFFSLLKMYSSIKTEKNTVEQEKKTF